MLKDVVVRKRTHKGPVNFKKHLYDGIEFSSGLELYCYKKLKEHGLFDKYEEESFNLVEAFVFNSASYERQSNGKGIYKNRGATKVRPMVYTPDFTSFDYIIECKGRANESFPLRYKLFKRWLCLNNDLRKLYKPQKKSEVDLTINLIKEGRSS